MVNIANHRELIEKIPHVMSQKFQKSSGYLIKFFNRCCKWENILDGSNIRMFLKNFPFRDDLKKSGTQYHFSHIVLILKIRIADSDGNKELNGASASIISSNRKKLTKAQKKRIAASAIVNAKVIYDNREEELLFQVRITVRI